jgi:hypothetical protein
MIYKIKQKYTKHTTIYTILQKWNQKNMKECDMLRERLHFWRRSWQHRALHFYINYFNN